MALSPADQANIDAANALSSTPFGDQTKDALIYGLYPGPRSEAVRSQATNGGAALQDRSWGNVVQPSAYEYGGYAGGAQDEQQRYLGLAGAADMRGGPQINNAAYNAQRQGELSRAGAQDYALGQYRGMIEGTGPSLAALQQQQAMSQAAAQGAQMSGAARGNQGLISAQNAGIMGGAGGASQAFGQGAQARAGEEFGALAGYSGLAGQQRGQDLQRAQMSGEQAYRQAQLDLAQRQRNDQRNQAFEGMRQNVFEQQMAGQQAGEAANAGIYNTTADLAQRQAEAAQSQQNAWITGVASGAGTGLAGLGGRK